MFSINEIGNELMISLIVSLIIIFISYICRNWLKKIIYRIIFRNKHLNTNITMIFEYSSIKNITINKDVFYLLQNYPEFIKTLKIKWVKEDGANYRYKNNEISLRLSNLNEELENVNSKDENTWALIIDVYLEKPIDIITEYYESFQKIAKEHQNYLFGTIKPKRTQTIFHFRLEDGFDNTNIIKTEKISISDEKYVKITGRKHFLELIFVGPFEIKEMKKYIKKYIYLINML